MSDELLTVAEAGEILDERAREVLWMIDRGELEGVRHDGQMMVRRAAVEAARSGAPNRR